MGQHHVLIDPDFYRPPEPGVEFVSITHGHEDHLGRVAQLTSAIVLASRDVCETAHAEGVPHKRLFVVEPGERVKNIQILPGYSPTGWLAERWARLWQRRHRLPGGTPLSFLVEDDLSLLHIGDGHRAPEGVQPDVLCLPWRRVPLGDRHYRERLIALGNRLAPPLRHSHPSRHPALGGGPGRPGRARGSRGDRANGMGGAAMMGNRAFVRLWLSQFASLAALYGLNFAAVMQMEQATHSSARTALVTLVVLGVSAASNRRKPA
jgi:hypothetical protein